MSKTDFIYLNIWCYSKYITIKQLNEWVKQFTLSVYASKYSAKFLSKSIFLVHTFNIYCMHIYNYDIKPCTYKWVFSYACVYYPVP